MSTLLFGKSLVAVELIGLGGAFYIFHVLNTDVEARRKMHATAPFVIEAFARSSGAIHSKRAIIGRALSYIVRLCVRRQDCTRAT